MPVPTDTPLPIARVAEALGLSDDALELYGKLKAKLTVPDRLPSPRGKLILVTAMTPTRAGAGKTVTSIGLGQAFSRLGWSHCVCVREPSLGPVFGIKGGGAGGGRASLVPQTDINLHFTGDLHAVAAAHNLLSALVDNHVHFDNVLDIGPRAIEWPRVLDVCDRQLRHVQLGLGGSVDGFAHPGRFDITAASEVMAVAALSDNREDLRTRLTDMIVGYARSGDPVRAGAIGAVGAMEVLLRDAMRPNLVQTSEGSPALVHLGPFANIAHGCSSVVATRMALGLSDYVITEAGFGADLGAEKFVHIKCRQAGLAPAAAVVVVTASALRKHGGAGKGRLSVPDPEAVARGMDNLRVHVENLRKLGVPCVVALNHFPVDSEQEVAQIRDGCDALGVDFERSEVFARGGEGGVALAEKVRALADAGGAQLRPLYAASTPLRAKVETLATELYRADGVDYTPLAERTLERLQSQGHGALSVCMAKTPLSLSDDPKRRGVPVGHRLRVTGASVSAGARFVVVRTGDVSTMPGLPRHGAAAGIGLDDDGQIRGVR